MLTTISVALIGLGNVGRNFLKILETKAERLRQSYEIDFKVVGIADSSGVAIDRDGFDPHATRLAKEAGTPVSALAGYQPNATVVDILSDSPGDVPWDLVLEASPVNLAHGDPGLTIARAALKRGIHVVLANKGPLVLAFPELSKLAAENGAKLGYSATVCGALPVINIGQRDLIGADVQLFRGIFNSTSNFILDEMATGRAYEDALIEAQQRGIAEADPTLDVEGWDTANKLVIIANSILGIPATLADVDVAGITGISAARLQAELAQGNTIKLVASAELIDNSVGNRGYKLSVAPTVLLLSDFLGSCDGWEMGVEIHSDLYGKMYHKIWEREPLPTAAAMLRDAVNFYR